MAQYGDGQVRQTLQALGEQTQDDTLAGARIAGDEREAAFANVGLLDAPEEVFGLRREHQRFGGKLLGERIPLQAVEGEQRFVHAQDSGSVGRYAGGTPVAA